MAASQPKPPFLRHSNCTTMQAKAVTTVGGSSTALQDCVDRYRRALRVPSRLLQIRPKPRGNPGRFAVLSPAITLSSLSSFEGFAEDFLANAMHANGNSLAQIARKIGPWNNPTVRDFQKRASAEFPSVGPALATEAFELRLYRRPRSTTKSGWWNRDVIDWDRLVHEADAWMQVRHCLTHGVATGWQSERWPGPLRVGGVSASEVLVDRGAGKHSLVLHNSLNCARIYLAGAQHIADLVSNELGHTLDWSDMPEFAV